MNQSRDDQDLLVDRALGDLRKDIEGLNLSPRAADLVRQLRKALLKTLSEDQ